MPAQRALSLEELLQDGFRYAYALAHHQEDAEDLVQTAWLRLYQRHGEIRSKALFFITIRHLYIDQYRRRKIIQFASPYDAIDRVLAPDTALKGVQKSDLDRMLTQLRDEEREALFLHVVEGYSAREIANITGKPRGTILSLMHRGRQKLLEVAGVGERPTKQA